MSIFNISVLIFSLLVIGFLIGFNIRILISFYENRRKIESLDKNFLNILNELESGRSRFKKRLNNNIYIAIFLEEYGYVDILYTLDNDRIALFKEDSCILTSTGIDKEIIKNISNFIVSNYKNDIDDVINLSGVIISSSEFERITGYKFKDLNKAQILKEELSDIDRILNINNSKFDLDEILDKISKSGIKSLTDEERIFLENQSKE